MVITWVSWVWTSFSLGSSCLHEGFMADQTTYCSCEAAVKTIKLIITLRWRSTNYTFHVCEKDLHCIFNSKSLYAKNDKHKKREPNHQDLCSLNMLPKTRVLTNSLICTVKCWQTINSFAPEGNIYNMKQYMHHNQYIYMFIWLFWPVLCT